MKLRAIRLTNIRRFAGQIATIEGLGDGLSVIAAPNESGKSTVFDALHALFFAPSNSRARDVTSLQPHAGGRIAIAADIDLPQGRFTLEKAWLSRAMARVTDRDSGAIIAQDDAAEDWIARITGTALRGPAGLLWVRQGLTTLDAPTPAERDRLLATRRDLLSSVTGEIDLMTGGRRMDRVRAACAADLDRLATATGKPRKGGPWADTLEEIAALDAEIATLTAQSASLAAALARRREIAARLAQIDHPETRAARESDLARATDALRAAEAHAARLAAATQEARLADLTATEATRRHAALAEALAPLPRLAAARDTTEAEAADLAARMATARAAEDTARANHETAATALTRARATTEAARRAETARSLAARRAALTDALAAAEEQARIMAEAEARIAALPVTEARLATLDRARDALAAARAAARAQAVTITPAYTGTARILRDGAPLAEGATPLTGPVTLDLPGIGRLAIDPGATAADPAALATAEDAVTRALTTCGADSAEAARAALARKAAAEAARTLAAERLRTLAPDGLPALRTALAALADSPAPDAALPPDDPAPPDLATAEAAESRARAALDTARAAAASLADPLARARAAADLAATRLAEAETAAGDPATRAARLAALAAEAAAANDARTTAESARAALAAAAPDLATARAEEARARSATAAAHQEAATLREEQARLAGIIQTQADLAVDERLADRHDTRAAAAARAARLAAEAASLTRLMAALDAARLAAREAYFGPVQRELAPLLDILAGDAALSFDADSLLPGHLSRAGTAEPLTTLSGGTQEQIAILTRLAFARLFARAGAAVPVILDDALIHTDDTRIIAMFTALHRVAADQQVIVFTCRTMAFAALGGTRPPLTVTPLT